MPGTLRCHVHKAYFGNQAWTMPKTTCGMCWKIHEEEIKAFLNRMGYKATLTITPLTPEDKATFGGPGAQAQGANMEITPEEAVELADPLAGVTPITETEGGGPTFVAGTQPMTVPEYKSPPGLEVTIGVPEEPVMSGGVEIPLRPEPGAVVAVPEQPVASPEIEVPAEPIPAIPETATEPAQLTTSPKDPGIQLDEAAEDVINSLLRGK